MLARGEKVGIPAHNRDKGLIYRFESKYEIEYTDADSEVISFANPTFGVTVTCDAPEYYQVTLSPKADVENAGRWSYETLFLPGEHIRIRWKRQSHPDIAHEVGKSHVVAERARNADGNH